MYEACEAGVLGCPPGTGIRFVYADDPEGGAYAFQVHISDDLRLISRWQEMRHLGVPSTAGRDAAIAVLREAAQEASVALRALVTCRPTG